MIKVKTTKTLLDKAWTKEVKGYVVFGSSAGHRWWNRFLHPLFQHCYIVVESNGVLVALSGNTASVTVGAYPDAEVTTDTDDIVVPFKATVDVRTVRAWWVLTPFTCVEVAKGVMGIRNPLLLTPYQLYKEITS